MLKTLLFNIMQVKNPLKFHLTRVKFVYNEKKTQVTAHDEEDVEQGEHSPMTIKSEKTCSTSMETSMRVNQEDRNQLTSRFSDTTLGHSDTSSDYRNTC